MARASVWAALAWAPLLLAALGGESGPVPDDVAAWFAKDAAATVTTVSEGLDTGPGPVGVTVGEPHALHLWSEELRAGVETDAPVVPLEQWIAPFSADGSPAGSVTAWREDGVVAFASADENAELATALVDLPTEALVVHEPMLGAHFALVGGTVTTLVPGFYVGAPSVALSTFQAALAEQVDGLLGGTAPEPGVQWWVPVTWGVLVAAVVAGPAAVTLAARRRAAPEHT